MFLGISLATQAYVNPSIDIIKKRGIVSEGYETDKSCSLELKL